MLKENFEDFKINGDLKSRLAGNINISFKNIDGSELLFKLDEYGICASAGSACSTSNPVPSHVLTAIGLNKELINGTLRISLGKDNTKEDIDFFIHKLKEIIKNKIEWKKE